MSVSKAILVTFDVLGFHRWPDAPDQVAYLRDRHRHLFWFQVEVGVEGSDREVEFHLLKGESLAAVFDLFPSDREAWIEFGENSCEMIAEKLGDFLRKFGSYDVKTVEVWEDRENGARVSW